MDEYEVLQHVVIGWVKLQNDLAFLWCIYAQIVLIIDILGHGLSD